MEGFWGDAHEVVADCQHFDVAVEALGVDADAVVLAEVVAIEFQVSLAPGFRETGLDGDPFFDVAGGGEFGGKFVLVVEAFEFLPLFLVVAVVIVGLALFVVVEEEVAAVIEHDGADAFEDLDAKGRGGGAAVVLGVEMVGDLGEFHGVKGVRESLGRVFGGCGVR